MSFRVVDIDHLMVRAADLAQVTRPQIPVSALPGADGGRQFPQHLRAWASAASASLPHTLGVSFAVDSLDAVASVLERNGVPTRLGVSVPRQQACKTLVEFIPAGSRAFH